MYIFRDSLTGTVSYDTVKEKRKIFISHHKQHIFFRLKITVDFFPLVFYACGCYLYPAW